MLRRLGVLRCAAAAAAAPGGWRQVPHRPVDYPELKDVPMWRSRESDAPQPVLVLTGKDGRKLTENVCKAMPNPAGCVMLELPERAVDESWMDEQCDLLLKFINVLYCPWVHVVSHSVGSLVALDLARRFPARVGTITVLDTVLSTPQCQEESDLRGVLVRSERDLNITDQDIENTKQRLTAIGEKPNDALVAPVDADKELFASLTGGVVAEDRTTKAHYILPYTIQRTVKHPMLLVRPGKKPVVANELMRHHKTTFHVKDSVNIASAGSHNDLFTKAADDVAKEITAFHNQFSIQHLVESRWETIKEAKLKAASTMGRDVPGAKGGDGKKGGGEKKGKKKKNKQ